MNLDDVALDDELLRLARQLQGLRRKLRDHAWREYRRLNPFVEDLFNWKEKGQFAGGNDVTIYESATVVGDVTIGDHTWVGPFCLLDGSGSLSIGSYCSISTGTQILTHDTIRWAVSGGRAEYERSPVRIGDRCFLGANSVVTRGVTIGSAAVVAAGAVVTEDVAGGTIVGGVPARPIGKVVIDGDAITLQYS